MFVMLQGGNYTDNLYLFLAIYLLYDKENSEKIESQFQCFLKFSQTVGSTFKVTSNYLAGPMGKISKFHRRGQQLAAKAGDKW